MVQRIRRPIVVSFFQVNLRQWLNLPSAQRLREKIKISFPNLSFLVDWVVGKYFDALKFITVKGGGTLRTRCTIDHSATHYRI